MYREGVCVYKGVLVGIMNSTIVSYLVVVVYYTADNAMHVHFLLFRIWLL